MSAPLPVPTLTVAQEARIRSYFAEAASHECWPWGGTIVKATGYGAIKLGRNRYQAHNVVYALLGGHLPRGLELDHACHTADATCDGGPLCIHRRCVNPSHLSPLAPGDNARFGRGVRTRGGRDFCRNGHEFDTTNTIVRPAGRECRTCRRERRLLAYVPTSTRPRLALDAWMTSFADRARRAS